MKGFTVPMTACEVKLFDAQCKYRSQLERSYADDLDPADARKMAFLEVKQNTEQLSNEEASYLKSMGILVARRREMKPMVLKIKTSDLPIETKEQALTIINEYVRTGVTDVGLSQILKYMRELDGKKYL